MENWSGRVPLIMARVFRQCLTLLQWLFKPSATVEGKQCQHLKLLSSFLLLIAIITLIGMVVMKNAGSSLWVVMLGTAAILVLGYVLSRTIYYRLATAIAVSIPAVPIIAMVLFSPNREVIPQQLPWLALPLLVCSVLLSLRHTVIIAICYVVLIMLFIPLVDIPVANLAEPLAFMFMIIFFVVVVTATSQQEQSEIEHQLAKRKAAEKALRESEEKFSKAFHASPAMASISTLKDGRIIEVNDSSITTTGYSREETIGHTAAELKMWVNPAVRDRIAQALEKEGRVRNIELEFRKKSGETHWVLFSSELINIGGEPCSLAVSTDITERKRAEEKLRKSEEKFSKAFRASPEMISITSLKDDKFLDVNDTFLRSTGLTRDELIGHTADELKLQMGDADRDRIAQIMENQGNVHNEEVRFFTESGEERFMLFSAELIDIGDEPCIIVLTNDITEQKRAEEKLRESEEKFRRSLDESPMGIRIIDAEGDETVYANKAMLDLYGYDSLKELKETPAKQRYTPQSYAEYQESWEKRKWGKGVPHRYELSIVRKDGEIRDLEAVVKEVLWDGKKQLQVIYNDITERKQAEMDLVSTQEKLKEAHRLAHIGTWDLIIESDTVTWSEELYNIVGWDPSRKIIHTAELPGLYTPDSWNRLNGAITKSLATGEPYSHELEIIRPDGSIRWVTEFGGVMRDGNGKVIGLQGTLQDITERKQAEEKLREGEEFSSGLLANSAYPIMVCNLDNTIKYVNPAMEELTSFSASELIGQRPPYPYWSKEKEAVTEYKKGLEEDRREGKFQRERNFRKKNGERFFVQINGLTITRDGEPKYHLINWVDLTERKRAENALRESEEKFFKAFRSSPDAIVISTLKGGVFVEVNDSFTRFIGYTREELIGRTSTEFETWAKAEDRARMLRILKKKGRVYNEEYNFRTKSGEIRTWLFSAELIDIGGETCLISVNTDITERKRAEEALRVSEEKYRAIFEQAADSIVLIEEEPMRIVDFNDKAHENLGYTREEFAKLPPAEINATRSAKKVRQNIGEIHNKGMLVYEEKQLTKSGELRDVRISSKAINIGGKWLQVGIWHDITEQKQMESALRLSDAAFRSIHESVIAVDTEETITHWNETSERMFGIKASEAIGKKLPDIVEVVESKIGNLEEIFKLLEKDGYIQDEQLHRTKQGEVWVDIRIQDIVGNGKRYGRVVLASDITTRKKAEEKLKQALSELEQSSARLAATNKELETFSYSVSHDLRSPLRSIDGFSQALLEDYSNILDENGRDYLGRLRGASQKMGELIDGLLKLSRLTRSEMHREKVNLGSLAEEIAVRLQETQPQRRVKFIIEKGLTTNGDTQLLRVLLENLLGNAWKFTGKTPNAKIEFGATRNNGKQAYFIKDNGAGFDMTYVGKLFGAFQRLHDTTEFPGTGIGLATVQRIINRHGGTIRAEGAPGKGATFYFTLD